MCYPTDAQPPVPPGSGTPPEGRSVTVAAADGFEVSAWRADTAEPSGRAVVILPDVRGLFGFYQRLAELFASIGIDALAIDYFARTAGVAPRDPEFEFRPHVEQTRYDTVMADITAGVEHLRGDDGSKRIHLVGFCFGGSYAFMSAARAELGLAGVIGFYGGMRQRHPDAPTPLTEASRASVPVLGLFGGADKSIAPEQIAEFTEGLRSAGVEHSIHTYPGAPHSFFDRSFADHTDECADAWRRVLDFIGSGADG